IIIAVALTIAKSATAGTSLLPPGFHATTEGTRFGVQEFSIAAPGKGWIEGAMPQGVVLVKRIDATESYHAGLKTTKCEPVTDKSAFLQFARRIVSAQSGNPRYSIQRHETGDYVLSGYWAVKDTVT